MKTMLLIAKTNVKRFVRNRSFFVVAFVAPFAIMAALSLTIGSALSGEFRPAIVIADEVGGGALDGLVSSLRSSGFDELQVVDDAATARRLVRDGEAGAAILYPPRSLAPTDSSSSSSNGITVVADGEAAGAVALAIAEQSARTFETMEVLGMLGAPMDDLAGEITVIDGAAVETRVLTDSTYFAVGMASYFVCFAAAGFVATLHRDRRQATLARMLAAPIERYQPIVGKAIAAATVALVSLATLIISSSLLLDSNWGPIAGVFAVGGAMCFTAVAVSLAVVSVTRTEEAAAQVGTVLATAWAIFGGVFLEIPTSGPLSAMARFSPFTWALEAIGLNAGSGTLEDVLRRSLAIALFGLVGLAVAAIRRGALVRA